MNLCIKDESKRQSIWFKFLVGVFEENPDSYSG